MGRSHCIGHWRPCEDSFRREVELGVGSVSQDVGGGGKNGGQLAGGGEAAAEAGNSHFVHHAEVCEDQIK